MADLKTYTLDKKERLNSRISDREAFFRRKQVAACFSAPDSLYGGRRRTFAGMFHYSSVFPRNALSVL